MKKLIIPALLTSAVMLVGCADPNKPIHESFGEATRNNMAAQIIDPAPAGEGPVVADGNNAAAATERYHTDTVKTADAASTSEAD